ncbi:hypothetical protein GC176_17925, partial [bacterium]|nr:hypothetical protein [bacterium]
MMRILDWLRLLRSRRHGCSQVGDAIRRRRMRQSVEWLEDRTLLAAISGFQSVGPAGALIEAASVSDSIATSGEVDAWTVDLDPGQTVSVVVVPNGSLQPDVEILDSAAATLAATTSSAVGDSLVIQTVAATSSGTYTINVGGASSTTGTYSLDVTLNAAIEPEQSGGAGNDSLATAQDLTASFLTLDSGASRGAVVAASEPRLGDDFESGSLDGRWTTNSSTADGRIQVTGTYGTGEGNYALLMDVAQDLQPNLNEATLTVDLSGYSAVTLEFQHAAFNDEESPLPDSFTGSANGDGVAISADGVTWYTVLNATTPAGWETVSIDLVAAADAAGILLGSDFQIRFQQFDNYPLTTDGRGYDGIRFRTTPSFITDDWYSFTLDDGQSASVVIDDLSGSGSQLELYDASQTLLTTGIAAANVEQSISGFVDLTSDGLPDTYYVRVVDSAPQYSLVVTVDAVFDLESNNSFDTAQRIGPNATVLGGVDAQAGAGLDLLQSFAGPGYTGFIPPDSTLAVGPGQVVTSVNTNLVVYDKATGNQIFSQNMNGSSGFFGSVGATSTVFDPWIIFDDDTQRFFVIGIDSINGSGTDDTSAVYLAVSTDSTPTGSGSADWHKYKIDFTHNPAALGLGSGNHFPDYEKVGVNNDALFISGNYFPIDTGSGVYAGITAIEKAPLLSGGPVNKVYEEFFNGFSVFPLNQFNSGSTEYFAEALGGSTIRIHAITDVLGTPGRDTFNLSVPSYNEPIDPPQSGGGTGADSVSSRIMTGVWRDGSAWFAHAITDPAIGDGEDVVRWYEVATNNFPVGTPTLVQSGNVDPGPGIHAWMPAIAVDGNGNMGIGFSTGGSEQFYGAAFTGRLATDPLGTVTTPVNEYATGLGNYELTDTGGRNRWGDYSGLAIDPSDDATFWVFNEYAAANNRWATQVGSFQLDPIAESDWFRIAVLAGDSLQIETATPFDGGNRVVNQLDPMVELYAPDGMLLASDDNSAADGRNAVISYSATSTGTYRVRILTAGDAGDYVLSVSGASGADAPPTVLDTSPDDGALLSSFPATYRIQFSEPLLASSVSAGDLLINGVPAAGVTFVSGDTFDFLVDAAANTGDGTYSVLILAGSVLDLAGHALAADFNATFDFDGTGPTITSTLWNGSPFPLDRTFQPGPLTIEATISEPLFLIASPRKGNFAPGADDVRLVEAATGQSFAPDSVTFDAATSALTVRYQSDLPAGSYTLTFVSGAGAFEDVAGSALDGEPIGGSLDGTPTGDGIAGGDYTVSFLIDEVSDAANDFERLSPLGSLVSRSADNTRVINSIADTDALTFYASAGETISAVATLAQNVTATLELIGVAAPVSSAAPGDDVLLAPVVIPADGVYELRLTADDLVLLNVDLFLNASLETIVGDSASGNELSLDVSRLSLGGGRYAVIGTSSPQVGTGAFDLRTSAAQFVDISATGMPLNLDDDEETTISTTVGNLIFPAGEVTVGNNGGMIAGAGQDLSSLNTALPSTDWVTALLPFWDDIDSTAGNVYWEERQIGGVNTLIVQWNDRPEWPDIGRATFELQLFETGSVQVRFAYKDVRFGDARYNNGADATIGVQLDAATFDQFSYLMASVSNNAVLDYVLPITPDVDEYTVDLSSSVGSRVDIALSGIDGADFSRDATLELVDPNGVVVATGSTMPLGNALQNADLAILNFAVPDVGDNVYTVRVTSSVFGDYSFAVTDGVAFDAEPSNSASDALQTLVAGGSLFGYLDAAGDSTDRVLIDLTAGASLLIQVATPFDNATQLPLNSLDAALTVTAPDGMTTVASDDNSLDGKNPAVTFTAAETGIYLISLSAVSGTGEYLLQTEATPHLLLTIDPMTIAENDGASAATATLTRTGDLSAPLTVTISIDDTSEAGTVSEVTIPANASSVSFAIDAVDDAQADGTQTVTLTASAVGFDPVTAQLGVTDNDTVGFSVTESGGTTEVGEAGTSDSVSVVLLSQPASDVVVIVASSDLSEATVSPGELTFTSSNWDQPQSITVTGVDDPVLDGSQSSMLTFHVDSVRSDAAFAALSDQTVSVTTLDDDVAGFQLTGGPLTVNEAGSTATFQIALTAQPLSSVVLSVGSNDATESAVDRTLVTFLPGEWNIPQMITVTGLDDPAIDGDQNSLIAVQVDAAQSDDAFDSLSPQTVSVTTLDNDVAGFAITESNGMTIVSESGTTDSFEVVLTAQPVSNVIISVRLSEQSELSINRTTLIFTPTDWNSPHSVQLTGRDDLQADGDQITTVTLTVLDQFSDASFAQVADQTVSATTLDDDVADFLITETNGGTTTSESGLTDTFSIVLTAQPNGEVILTVASADATEVTTAGQFVSFNSSNWNMPQSVTVQSVDDPAVDGTRMVDMTLAVHPAASDDAFDLLPPKAVSVTSLDNDAAGFAVSETGGETAVDESGSTDTLSVVLTAQPLSDVVLQVETNDATEVSVLPATLTFTPSNWNVAQIVTVTGVDDEFVDGTQTSQVTVSLLPAESDEAFDLLAPQSVMITTVDNDVAGFLVTETDGDTQVSESGPSDTFSVVLTSRPLTDVVLTVIGSDASAATADQSSLTFTMDNWNVPQSVTVTGIDDAIVDGTQISSVTVAIDAAATDDSFAALSPESVTVSTLDDDLPGFAIHETAGTTVVSETGTTDSFSVVLTAEPAGNVVFDLSSADTGEVTLSHSQLTFTPQNWALPQSVTVTGQSDGIVDGAQQIAVTVALNPGLTNAAYQPLTDQSLTVTVSDADVAGFLIQSAMTPLEVSENGTTDQFTVVLTTQPMADVVFDLSVSDATEVEIDQTTLTFTPLNWDTPQLVTVTGQSDGIVDGSQQIALTVALNPSLTDAAYQPLADQSLAVTVTDVDIAGFLIQSAKMPLEVSEKGTTDEFSVVLTAQPLSDVVFDLSVSDATEVGVDQTSLTFTPQNWDTPQTVTVTGVDDSDDDGNQLSTVSVAVRTAESDSFFATLPTQTIDATTLDYEGVLLLITLQGATDVAVFAGSDGNLGWSLTGDGLADVSLAGTSMGEVIPASEVRQISVTGSDEANVIDLSGVTRAAFIRTGGVTVSVSGLGGNDSIIGSEFGDQLVGGADDDLILAGSGDDSVFGGAAL